MLTAILIVVSILDPSVHIDLKLRNIIYQGQKQLSPSVVCIHDDDDQLCVCVISRKSIVCAIQQPLLYFTNVLYFNIY